MKMFSPELCAKDLLENKNDLLDIAKHEDTLDQYMTSIQNESERIRKQNILDRIRNHREDYLLGFDMVKDKLKVDFFDLVEHIDFNSHSIKDVLKSICHLIEKDRLTGFQLSELINYYRFYGSVKKEFFSIWGLEEEEMEIVNTFLDGLFKILSNSDKERYNFRIFLEINSPYPLKKILLEEIQKAGNVKSDLRKRQEYVPVFNEDSCKAYA